MTNIAWIVLVIVLLAIAVTALLIWKSRRTKRLRAKFGPEYDRLARERGAARAEKELEHRAEHVQKLHIRPLSRQERDGFAGEWRRTQERFVDDPRNAVAEADELVHRTMKTRGYMTGADFESRAAELSVDHPLVLDHYRAAHAIAVRDAERPVSTEDLRVAMKHYRALFEDLLEMRVSEVEEVKG